MLPQAPSLNRRAFAFGISAAVGGLLIGVPLLAASPARGDAQSKIKTGSSGQKFTGAGLIRRERCSGDCPNESR